MQRDKYQDAVRRLQYLTRVLYPVEVDKPDDVLRYQGDTLRSVACE
jgi:hypothetical protein